MKKILKYSIALMLLMASTVACKKDDENRPQTKKEMVTKKWSVQEVLINSLPDNSQDYSSFSYQFNSDGTYSINNGGVQTGTWELNSSETIIILDKGTVNERLVDLFQLGENQMVIEITIPATWKEEEKVIRITLKK